MRDLDKRTYRADNVLDGLIRVRQEVQQLEGLQHRPLLLGMIAAQCHKQLDNSGTC